MIHATVETSASPIAASPILDKSIVRRALACYLPGSEAERHDPAGLEPTLNHALEFLRCASATASETCDNLTGSKRDLALASMHMLEMAKVMVECSLEIIRRS